MRQVAGRYGYEPNRSGFLRCPFHSGDHTASLKIYPDDRGWYCFGCHRGGGPVEFVMELEGLPFREAISKLNSDFSLGLTLFHEDMTPMELERMKREAARKREEVRAEREAMARQDAEELRLTLMYRTGWTALRDKPEEQWTPLECECVRDLAVIEYRLENLIEKRWADGNRILSLPHNKTIPTTQTHIKLITLCETEEDPEMTRLFIERCAESYGNDDESECDPHRGGEVDLHQGRLSNWKETIRRALQTEG